MNQEILELIARHDGSWTWYQLERALGERAEVKAGQLPAALNELERNGLIVASHDSRFPQPVYRLTEKGLSLILGQ